MLLPSVVQQVADVTGLVKHKTRSVGSWADGILPSITGAAPASPVGTPLVHNGEHML